VAIANRPYVGTWQLNNRKVVKHAPDALVYVNGQAEIAGCPTCGGRIDIQQYITSVTVDPSTQPGSNASITMQIPRQTSQAMFRDGQFVLQTGMEINIYLRGYFPMKGVFSGVTSDMTGGLDITSAVVYPYYHVFHGVVTEVSHEYSGGEHTASLSCIDILHFWSNLRLSTSGSIFGARPKNSNIHTTLIGHTLTGMTPYSIMYTLYRSTMGAAGGVGFAMGSHSNVAANSTATSESMWSMAGLYWEKRFAQHFNALRMYGMDGSLYNAYEQAFLGKLTSKNTKELVTKFSDPNYKPTEKDPLANLIAAARAVGYDLASLYAGAASEANAKAGGIGININQLQAFVSDVSNWGNVNLYESEYQTKLEIASTITELTGFEFFQDVDGDFVFKPPFYNLDTSSSPVYVIEDVDIITFSASSGEPEATVVKATSSQFTNMEVGLSGEMGNRSVYVDYRLVAKYGWRENDFETAYLTDPRAMYFACINRMDLFNIGVESASCQIPLRPEIRPGYPVYIRYLDCFFYVQSFNHSFAFGGQCTTSLNLVAKRAKFHAPGLPPEDGSEPTTDDIHLDNPWLPTLPLLVEGNDGGIPRYQGFPNVVLGIDPELLNPNFYIVGFNIANLAEEGQMQALVRVVQSMGILEIDEDKAGSKSERDKWLEGPFLLRTGDDVAMEIPTIDTMVSQVQEVQAAQNQMAAAQKAESERRISNAQTALDAAEGQAAAVQALVDAARDSRATAIGNDDETANYFDALMDLKAAFSPGMSTPGYYRYYSASHPDESQQGMKDIVADAETGDSTQSGGLIYLEGDNTSVFGFQNSDSKNVMTDIPVVAGLPLMRPNTGKTDARAVPTPTHQIGAISFAQHRVRKEISVPRLTGKYRYSYPPNVITMIAARKLDEAAQPYGQETTVYDRFVDAYDEISGEIRGVVGGMGYGIESDLPDLEDAFTATKIRGKTKHAIYPNVSVADQFNSNERKTVTKIAKALGKIVSESVGRSFLECFKNGVASYGRPGNNRDLPAGVTVEDKDAWYTRLDGRWAYLVETVAGQDHVASPKNDDYGGLSVYVPGYSDTALYSPVFPVSDERGYEVIGSYRYGRGLSIEEGGNFQTLTEGDPFANVSVEAVAEFLQSIENTGNVSKALGDLAGRNPGAAAELAMAAGNEVTGVEGEGVVVLDGITVDGDKFAQRFGNFISSSKEFSQKVTVDNAAYGLADLGLQNTTEICTCKGAEADVLLMAFADQTFVNVDQPDDVSAWLADKALESGVDWQQSQKALRGEVQDSSMGSLADAFQAAGDIESAFEGLGEGLSQINETAQADLEQAQQDIDDSVQDLTGGEDG
jgi:hypothetical protein